MFFTKKNFNFPASFEKALFEYWFQDPNATANQYKSKEFNRKTETIAQNLEHLWTLLAIDRGMNSQKKFAHYSMNEKFTHAYASYYLPANALKSTLILEEMFQMGLDLPDEIHWSDFGTGPGTLFWGLLQFFENHKEKKIKFTGFDQSFNFLTAATKLSNCIQRQYPGQKILTQWNQLKKLDPSYFLSAKPNIISFMNSIGEFFPAFDKRIETLNSIIALYAEKARKENKTHWLIIIEPGSQKASRELLELRKTLTLNTQLKLWLPCLDNRNCGALEKSNDWCHEEVLCKFPEWLNDFGKKTDLKKDAMIFSYLVYSVGVHPNIIYPREAARLVSPIMKEKGSSQCFLCTKNGKIKARVLDSKKDLKDSILLNSSRGEIFDQLQLSKKNDIESISVYQKPRSHRQS